MRGIRFTYDGRFLLSYGSDNVLRLWDATSGKNALVCYVDLLYIYNIIRLT